MTDDEIRAISLDELGKRYNTEATLGTQAHQSGQFQDAARHFGATVQAVREIDRRQSDGPVDDGLMKSNVFSAQFNHALLLFKADQWDRALVAACDGCDDYAGLIELGAAVDAATREQIQGFADALVDILAHAADAAPGASKIQALRTRGVGMRTLADAQPLVFRQRYGVALNLLALEAHRHGLQQEAESVAQAAITALRAARKSQGDTVLRDLGNCMRFAIDSLGREDLRAEYDELVQREVALISGRVQARHPSPPPEPDPPPEKKPKKRKWWPFG